MSGDPAGGSAAGWAWVEHLRAGGTTPWGEYAGGAAAAGGADRAAGHGGRTLPGAAQLEVLRRLNRRHGGAVPADLADRVLGASGPGRGQPDRSLAGVGDGTRFGPPPAEPERIDPDELTRIAVGVLAELALAVPGSTSSRAEPMRAPWRRDHRLVGDPVLADGLRAALRAAGHRRGRRKPVVVVLGRDLGTLLADVWRWRVLHGATPSWPWWIAHWQRRDELPPRADLAALARTWSAGDGAGRVHVVLEPDPAATTARLVGHRGALVPSYALPGPVALEVLRRTNAVLRVLVPVERHVDVLDRVLVPLTARHDTTPAAGPAVPDDLRDWVRGHAERLRVDLADGGYPVHGDPETLLPDGAAPAPGAPAPEAVLDVALGALLSVKEAGR